MESWNPEADKRRLECIHTGRSEIRQGDRVRLRPQGRADILDIALVGKTARVEVIEEDFDGRVYLAVTVEDDPGRDLGELRQSGHRFFFRPEDVEPLEGQLSDEQLSDSSHALDDPAGGSHE